MKKNNGLVTKSSSGSLLSRFENLMILSESIKPTNTKKSIIQIENFCLYRFLFTTKTTMDKMVLTTPPNINSEDQSNDNITNYCYDLK